MKKGLVKALESLMKPYEHITLDAILMSETMDGYKQKHIRATLVKYRWKKWYKVCCKDLYSSKLLDEPLSEIDRSIILAIAGILVTYEHTSLKTLLQHETISCYPPGTVRRLLHKHVRKYWFKVTGKELYVSTHDKKR